MTDQTDILSLRAARTRNHLSDLVNDLQHQITPAELLNQLVGYRSFNANGSSLTQTLASQISKNPLACALIAAGIGWLIFSDHAARTRPAPRRRVSAKRASASARKRRPRRKGSPGG